MAMPSLWDVTLPLLKLVEKKDISIRDAAERLSDHFKLSAEERAERLTTGRLRIYDRVGWARVHLRQSGLVDLPSRGTIRITERGRQELRRSPKVIDRSVLIKYPEYIEFLERSGEKGASPGKARAPQIGDASTGIAQIQTPEERIDAAFNEHSTALKSELIDRILEMPPAFFERLILDLMQAMGYGGLSRQGPKHLGGSRDGGIDGLIQQDPLGLDVIYLQAKRYSRKKSVPPKELRDFVGALSGHGAVKGVFVTTSRFSDLAIQYCDNVKDKKVIRIDGEYLSDLLIKHNVGARVISTRELKRIDDEYFS